MAETSGQVQRRAEKASPNVYTVRALIAFIALVAGTVFVVMRAMEMYESPIEVMDVSLAPMRQLLALLF